MDVEHSNMAFIKENFKFIKQNWKLQHQAKLTVLFVWLLGYCVCLLSQTQ